MNEKLRTKYTDNPPKHVLIVLLGAIGDVVRAFPLVGRIKQNWPEANISWAVESSSAGLVRECEFVSNVYEFKRKDGFFAYLNFIKEIRKNRYDLVLDLQRHFKSGITSYLSRGVIRFGFNYYNSRECNWIFNTDRLSPVSYSSDKIEQYMKFADALGLSEYTHPYDYGLRVTQEQIGLLRDKLDRFFPNEDKSEGSRVMLIVGSTWRSKEWPSQHYAQLAEDLYNKEGLISYLVGAGSDKKKAREIIDIAKVPVRDLTGNTSFSEYMAMCKVSRFGVGSDSGPLHIAGAIGFPVISLWGPTTPLRSRPYQNFDNIIQSPIGCQGCYQRICPGLDGLCLSEISPDVVQMKANILLKAI